MADEVFVCFEGRVIAGQEATSTRFYETLSELVVKQDGFISQAAFHVIDQESVRVLYVKFHSEQHIRAWKDDPTHSTIQAQARAQVFSDYRIRSGSETLDSEVDEPDNITASAGKYLLLWQYPASSAPMGIDLPQSSELASSPIAEVWQNLVDAATYVNETHILCISSWATKRTAQIVKHSIPRIDGDELYLIRVARDYGKSRRTEAPIDTGRLTGADKLNGL